MSIAINRAPNYSFLLPLIINVSVSNSAKPCNRFLCLSDFTAWHDVVPFKKCLLLLKLYNVNFGIIGYSDNLVTV